MQEKRKAFDFTFRYIDDVLSLHNSMFGDFVRIYSIYLEIKDTTDTDRSASYLGIRLENDSEGRLRTKLYDKRDDFNFPIVNFSFICSNIPAAPTYWVYISQLIRYSRACGSYQDFLDRELLLTRKLLNQGFLLVKLKSSLRKFYGRRHDLIDRPWNICVVNTSRSFPHSWLITGVVTRLTRRVPLVEQELLTLPEQLSSPPGFIGVRVTRSLVLCVCFVFVVCPFSVWPLCCLFFFDIPILSTPLVSPNSSYVEINTKEYCIVNNMVPRKWANHHCHRLLIFFC